MSVPGNGLDAKVRHLVEVVTRHRDEHCASVIEEARAEARAAVKTAWREARARMHRDNIETRRRLAQQLASHEAQVQTRRRRHRQAQDETLLVDARAALQAALERRWRQRETRQAWWEALVDAAAATLSGKGWTVEHPPDWPVSEQDELRARVESLTGKPPRLEAGEAIPCGLRISAGDTCMDATLEGLLHDRSRIDAELLALCADRGGERA